MPRHHHSARVVPSYVVRTPTPSDDEDDDSTIIEVDSPVEPINVSDTIESEDSSMSSTDNEQSKKSVVNMKRLHREKLSGLTTGGKPSTPRGTSPSKFYFRSFIQEKAAKIVYDVQFNQFPGPNQPNIFAAVAGNRVSLYQCEATPNGRIKLIDCYEDPDKQEDFYTCCWSYDPMKRSVLMAGGKRGVIQIIYPEADEQNLFGPALKGHGAEILDLKSPPSKPFMLASASTDRSFRLWNIQTGVTIATFFQNDGHREDVVSIDFNNDCSKLVSSGTDHRLIIWNLQSPEVATAIEASRWHNDKANSFKTVYYPFSEFETRDIHNTHIDCVKWFGELIISKALADDLICWKPGLIGPSPNIAKTSKSTCSIIKRFKELTDCTYYYVRFALNKNMTALALGNDKGTVKIWNLDVDAPEEIRAQTLTHKKCKTIVRQLTFSRCGRILIFACDDGTIWRYERK